VRLDLVDPELAMSLTGAGAGPDASAAPGVAATLLQPTAVAVPFPGSAGSDDLLLRLPKGARVSYHGEIVDRALGPAMRPAVSGFEPVGGSLLELVHPKAGRIRLPFNPRGRELALEVTVPRRAAPGDEYTLEIVQLGARGRTVGGCVLTVRVKK
jgi:hypothetical protein